MACRTNEDLQRIINKVLSLTEEGKVADYIPALAKANKNDLSVAIFKRNNECLYAGTYTKRFTLQSISKVLVLALALQDRGVDYVFERVGMEPTGDPFNSISKLETSIPSKPLNPMINAGALAVTNMIKGENEAERWERILRFVQCLGNKKDLTYDEEVAASELDTAWLNRSLCYFMKQHKVIEGDIEDLMMLYTKQCAIEMNCFELSRIGAVFALNGLDPETGERLLPLEIARICKTFMVTCGMYNASGEFAIKVGIPAKSGVSGGILAVVPEKYGIGIFGPSLDEKGNSIAGIKLLEELAVQYDFSIF
ncbi:glutaminase A [Bacillus sp. DTU_2020_1000418_1_SI_GHA_SEK_038]|uniref:glutaminase A n=1 Tax=Bacillus sp. DTU_2020_1000418_1_SI_GHA_SEK_038 TaxID=3077585 RepID=UPI0028EB0EA1|nr:glutaminase A [Bacillus sp. DTU_2020_1000418_1_SI_GHA_SEK_038]WNS77035.1 glutaminase A [Bacillus sp. DTU_2020_1000418_1_SI_GHA_SEK_038]